MSGPMANINKPLLFGDLRVWALILGDSLELLARLPDASADAVVTDPPYGIDISQQGWDGGALAGPHGFQHFTETWAKEICRILKPGAHIVAFGSPRTVHRLTCGMENAGLEIRDTLFWLHGRGVPKSAVNTNGVGLGLRPAFEPIVLARAPLSGSAKATIATFGTGGLNIDACRVPRVDADRGYWPSPLLLNHEPGCTDLVCQCGCAVSEVDALAVSQQPISRMFFAAKTSKVEREAGLENLPRLASSAVFGPDEPLKHARANIHPTVKPVELMRWLVRLVCPLGGVVIDPFTGSGSTGIAAGLEDRQFVGIEREPDYVRIARARLHHWLTNNPVQAKH